MNQTNNDFGINDGDSLAIPAAVSYVVPELPDKMPENSVDIDKMRQNITLQIQGDAVEIGENHPIPVLMVLFDIARRFCPEFVLKLNSGQRVLIFDRQAVPVLRDDDIIEIVINSGNDNFNEKNFVEKNEINLGEIWEKQKNLEKSVIAARELYAPSMAAVLYGLAPAQFFLTVQDELYGKTAEIWYQENSQSKSIKITSNL